MVYTKNLVLVSTGRNAAHTAQSGLPVLSLCLAVSPCGTLCRTHISSLPVKSLLGLRDLPCGLTYCNAEAIAAALLYEAQRCGAIGIFTDFEHDTPLACTLLRQIDRVLNEAGIPLFVPYRCRRAVSYAVLTIDTAISGGSLIERITGLQGTYGPHRVAAFLRPVSADFTLPSGTSDGVPLSRDARQTMLAQSESQVFFSRELCAKYFTFTDEVGQAHFVLFDDASTLQAKLAQLSGCGVQTVFALWEDAADLIR